MDIETEVERNPSELTEQDISLDEVISNTHFVDVENQESLLLMGSYICTLIYENNTEEYFINHSLQKQNITPVFAATIDLSQTLDGCDVLVVFDGGDSRKPIVTGVIRKCINARDLNPKGVSVKKDKEETLFFEADKEIVFKCGKASITLTKAGKVLIRGAYLLSRSSGANRIKGGSVHLN